MRTSPWAGIVVVVVAVALALAVRTAGGATPDDDLARRVAGRIAAAVPGAYAATGPEGTGWSVDGPGDWRVAVSARGGDVVLAGAVPRSALVATALRRAREIAGVRHVRGALAVEPPYPAYGFDGAPAALVALAPTSSAAAATPRAAGAGGGTDGTVAGRVTDVDASKRRVTVRTDDGVVRLALPATAFAGIGPGADVQVALHEVPPPTAPSTPRGTPTPQAP